ncbi:MAG: hypothetical protein R3F19_17995 [Verrucomicrobiales bacterium]
MRGSPILRTSAAFVGVMLLAALLFRITDAGTTEYARIEIAESDKIPTLIRIRSSHAPAKLTLMLESREVARVHQAAGNEWEIESRLEIPPGGVELLLEASWPENDSSAAVMVELEPDALDVKSQTAWSDAGELRAYLTFRWP